MIVRNSIPRILQNIRLRHKDNSSRQFSIAKVAKGLVATDDVIVHEQRDRESNFNCHIVKDGHVVVSDLDVIKGGANAGLSPKQLCFGALGSCTIMTIRTFFENTKLVASQNSEWYSCTLNNISVDVKEVDGSVHVPTKLKVAIRLEGQLTSSQKARLLRAAAYCPIKKMLSGSVVIDSILSD